MHEAASLHCHPTPRLSCLQDEDDGYTGELLSKWMANKKMGKNTDVNEQRGVFVVRPRAALRRLQALSRSAACKHLRAHRLRCRRRLELAQPTIPAATPPGARRTR